MIKTGVLVFLLLCTSRIFAIVDSTRVEKRNLFKKEITGDFLFSLKAKTGIAPFFLHSLGEQACAPFHMNGRQGMMSASAVAITFVLFHFDSDIDKIFKPVKDKNAFLRKVDPQFTDLGDYYGYELLAGFGALNLAFHDYKGFHSSVLAAQAAISAGLWIRAGKILTGRMRPGATYADRQYKSDHWFGPFAQFKSSLNAGRSVGAFDAFPSGHTGAAFAVATVFAKEYKNHPVVPFISYSLATLVGISRLVEHDHWASDVFAGGVIGYLCATQVINYDSRLHPSHSLTNVIFSPSFDSTHAGFTLLAQF